MKTLLPLIQAGVIATLALASHTARAGSFTVGPDYHAPTNSLPANFKSAGGANWKESRPRDAAPKGDWWRVFQDEGLNQLEADALARNQDLQAALARVDQARATARIARGALLPSASFDPALVRQHYSPQMVPSFGDLTANTYRAPLDLSYEVDLWGRVRRGFEGARADAQAAAAAYQNVLLTLQADVAQNYFSLRALDAEIATVVHTVALRREQLQLVRSRFDEGLGNQLEVAQAETELAGAEAEAAATAKHRDELENAVAILVGANPAVFHLPAATDANYHPVPPVVPAGLPAELLERRPDVAEAERRLASANAKIGVAKAAFFPVLTLTGSGGYLSGDVDSLFKWDSRTWSLGPSLSLPIFAGGRNRAGYQHAQAAFEESAAVYREHVLVAFGDVESSLSGIRHLADQAAAQARAVASARRSAELAADRYRSGISSYLEVVDANRETLAAERADARLTGQRLAAAVQLVKALGGGWTLD